MTGILLADLKYQVVEPALVAIGLMTTAGLNLVTGTALAESAAGAAGLVQHPSGPALGIFQIEPETEQDIWNGFLASNEAMADRVRSLLAPGDATKQLKGNLSYGAAMARLVYWVSPDPLPAADDAAGLCGMWKSVFNTSAGAGTVDAAHIELFQAAIDA